MILLNFNYQITDLKKYNHSNLKHIENRFQIIEPYYKKTIYKNKYVYQKEEQILNNFLRIITLIIIV